MDLQPVPKSLPDVAREKNAETFSSLEWVGMDGIEMPLRLGQDLRVPAKVDAFVSLDRAPSRGIHMSRLFLAVHAELEKNILSNHSLETLIGQFLSSHEALSSAALVRARAEWPVKRPALKSGHKAWRSYPVSWAVRHERGQSVAEIEVQVLYSSTCPASAALARQLIQENFRADFSGQDLNIADVHQWLGETDGISATPHAQRSQARVKVRTLLSSSLTPEILIAEMEEALQTPVQGAVKREDEQEFALRNGQNLMFCEDAARRLQARLSTISGLVDFLGEVRHFESLHPHNASARFRFLHASVESRFLSALSFD